MPGHIRRRSVYRLIAAKRAAERARYLVEVRAEVVAILTERRYRLLSLNYLPGSATWAVRFCAAESDDEQHESSQRGTQALYDHLRLHPVRVPRAAFVNSAALTWTFLQSARQGFQALAGFTRPQ